MRKNFNRILATALSIVLLLATMPLSGIVSAAANVFTEDFADISEWENVAGNYRTSATPLTSINKNYPTMVETLSTGETVLVPGNSGSRASVMLTPTNWYTDARVEKVTSTFKIPNTVAGNPDSCPGVYAVNIDGYKGLVLQVNSNNAAATSGKLQYQWLEFEYYDITDTSIADKNKVFYNTSDANAYVPSSFWSVLGSRTITGLTASVWTTVTITYDYSQIENNKLTVTAVFSQEGADDVTTSYQMEFDDEIHTVYGGTVKYDTTTKTIIDYSALTVSETGTYNTYKEGFKVGISGTSTKYDAYPFYFDSFAVEFEKTVNEYVSEFKTEHKTALALTKETLKSSDKEIVLAAIGDYETLSEDAKTALATEYELLLTLKSEFTNIAVNSGLLTENFEGGIDNWEILNAEGGVTGASTFTDAEGGIVSNPLSSDINSSANVLSADGVSGGTSTTAFQRNITIYKLKDSILANAKDLGAVSGKVYQKACNFSLAMILEYTDSNNYAGILFSSPGATGYGDTYSRQARAFKYVDGVGTQYANASYTKNFIVQSDCLSDWQYFTVEYKTDRVRLAFTDENGIYDEHSYFEFLYGDTLGGETAVFTGENCCFAVSGWNSQGNSIPYFDDLEFSFADSDYEKAAQFIGNHYPVLSKNAKTIAPIDTAEVTSMLSAYNTLSDTAKAHLDIATQVASLEAAVWGDNAAAEYTSRYSTLINGEITAENTDEFEAAWCVINRLVSEAQKELSELRATLVSKLTAYSGTLELTDKIKVNVIGDSITYGYGVTGTSANAWPAKLQSALGDNYEISNFAVSGFRVVGDYGTGAVQYLTDRYGNTRKLSFDIDADIAIIALGINDSAHLSANFEERYPLLVNGYKALINNFLATETCSTVIVSGSLWDYDSSKDEYNPDQSNVLVNKAAKEACEATGAVYTDLYGYLAEKIPGKATTYLQSDKLHYTEEGEQLIADYWIDLFQNRMKTVFRTENASYFKVLPAEEEYIPTADGATIKKSGTQDIQFTYSFGEIREDKEIAEYGMLLTLKALNFAAEDFDLDNTDAIEAKTIKKASSTDVADVEKDAKFVASIGEIPEELYTYSYQSRVYVKYTDGTVDYSAIEERSVAGVAKSIAGWVYEHQSEITGLTGDINALVSDKDGTLTADGKANNGAAILEYLTTNNDVIASAINTIGQ